MNPTFDEISIVIGSDSMIRCAKKSGKNPKAERRLMTIVKDEPALDYIVVAKHGLQFKICRNTGKFLN